MRQAAASSPNILGHYHPTSEIISCDLSQPQHRQQQADQIYRDRMQREETARLHLAREIGKMQV
jgi:hypothetical protein